MTKILYLFICLVIIIISGLVIEPMIRNYIKEGYSNLANAGKFPISVDKPLLGESYPLSGNGKVSDNDYNKIWWYYPIFKVGSYAQITNNLKYHNNPDDGQCTTAEFCGALYKDRQLHTNISQPLPPVPNTPGTRIGYYRTPDNLFMGPQPGPIDELPTF